MTKPSGRPFEILVDNKRMTTAVRVDPMRDLSRITADAILEALAAENIQVGEEAKQVINRLVSELSKGTIPSEDVVVAEGKQPVHGEDGRVEIVAIEQAQKQPSEKEKISHYDRTSIITVTEGQVIARIIPPKPHEDGLDVYGKTIPARKGKEAKVKLGENAAIDEDGHTIRATINGRLQVRNGKISVEPVLEITGNVDFETGNIDFEGDVFVAKNVLDLFKVHSRSNITVRGLVEAAELVAGGDIYVGGVAGKEKGLLKAQGSITAKFLDNARLIAGGDVNITSEAVNSYISCGGELRCENGQILGGRICARGGVIAKKVGSSAGVRTVLIIGVDEQAEQKARKIADKTKKLHATVDKVRGAVKPLLERGKNLSATQKEQATELLMQTYELEKQIEQLELQRKDLLESAEQFCKEQLELQSSIHPGTVIIFRNYQTTIDSEMSGPLRIAPRQIDGTWRIVATNPNTGSVQALKTAPAPRDRSLQEQPTTAAV